MLYENKDWGQTITNRDIFPYLLTALHNLGISDHRVKVMSETKKLLEANDDLLEKRAPDGNLLLDKAIIWAMSTMRYTNYTEYDSRQKGFWHLSKKGEQEVAALLNAEDKEDKVEAANKLRKEIEASYKEYLKRKKQDANQRNDSSYVVPDIENKEEPDAELAAMEKDLGIVKLMDPFAFERLCVGLLRKMGGQEMEVTQRTGDGGIDGVGYVEVGFVRFKVVMQAKRYNDSKKITGKQITDFLGSMQRFGAEKSVFITTTDFNTAARKLAKEHLITLIDGMELIELMKQYNVGYSTNLSLDSFSKQ